MGAASWPLPHPKGPATPADPSHPRPAEVRAVPEGREPGVTEGELYPSAKVIQIMISSAY